VTAATQDRPAATGQAQAGEADQARIAEGEAAIRALRFVKRIVLVLLFVAGLGVGLLVFRAANPPLQYGNLPPLTEAAEPAAADQLTDMLVAGDESKLAEDYDSDLLQNLAVALTMGPNANDPLVQVVDIQYLGSVAQGADILSFYVATGTMSDGTDGEAGFSLRVRDGQVVGVN
jgi:hypothetical protein